MKKEIGLLTILALTFASAKYKNPDKEYAIIPITQGVYFEDIECSNHLRYEHETYYEGTACENVSYLHTTLEFLKIKIKCTYIFYLILAN